jgi:hypothetical protein
MVDTHGTMVATLMTTSACQVAHAVEKLDVWLRLSENDTNCHSGTCFSVGNAKTKAGQMLH